MEKPNVAEMMKKIEVFEGMKRLVIEILVEVISGVITKLISGGVGGRQYKPKWAGA